MVIKSTLDDRKVTNISLNKGVIYMEKAKTPIRTTDIKERAARKLGQTGTNQSTKQANKINITGRMVKPIHVSKTDPLVKRITNYQKIN